MSLTISADKIAGVTKLDFNYLDRELCFAGKQLNGFYSEGENDTEDIIKISIHHLKNLNIQSTQCTFLFPRHDVSC